MIASLAAAVGFLTVIPVPRSVHENSRALARSVWWFPVVGALAGLIVAALDSALGRVFPPEARTALAVVGWAALSRGLHMDGLADTADGLLSFRPRQAVLEIMRDPRTGPMGVTAVASVLAMKMAAAHSLAGPARWDALFLAALAGRCAMAAVMGLHPYAREAGVASPFQSGRGGWKAAWAFGCLLIAAGCLFRGRGEVMGLAAVVFVWGFSSWVRRKIGGYTGDTLGAVCELTEVFVLLSAAAV